MTGNPLISREKRAAVGSFTLSVDASCFLLFRPVSGCCGSRMGADGARRVRQEPAPAVRCPPVALTDFSTLLVTCACYGDESNADRHAHGGD